MCICIDSIVLNRRSLSPIAMRPSSLGPVKRKFDLDDNDPPAKRLSMGLLMPHSR